MTNNHSKLVKPLTITIFCWYLKIQRNKTLNRSPAKYWKWRLHYSQFENSASAIFNILQENDLKFCFYVFLDHISPYISRTDRAIWLKFHSRYKPSIPLCRAINGGFFKPIKRFFQFWRLHYSQIENSASAKIEKHVLLVLKIHN